MIVRRIPIDSHSSQSIECGQWGKWGKRAMCWGCKPTCGNCKPPLHFYVQCPSCGHPHKVTREDYLCLMGYPHKRTAEERARTSEQVEQSFACTQCGSSVAGEAKGSIEPKPCAKSNIICGYPCGQRDSKQGAEGKRCEKMVPLRRLGSIEP